MRREHIVLMPFSNTNAGDYVFLGGTTIKELTSANFMLFLYKELPKDNKPRGFQVTGYIICCNLNFNN